MAISYHIRCMLRLSTLLCLVGGLVAGVPEVRAQVVPEFSVDAVSARATGSLDTRLDVYTMIPMRHLRFINTPDGFQARYEVTLEVYAYDADGQHDTLVQSHIWEQVVNAPDYENTQQENMAHRAIQSLDLPPGAYLLQLSFEDKTTKKSFVKELPVRVRDLSDSLAASDVVLINHYDDETKSITPTVTNNVPTSAKNIQFFQEIYSDRPRQVHVEREVVRLHKGSGGLQSVKSLFGFGKNDDDAEDAEVKYHQTEPTKLRRGRNPFVVKIPVRDFKVGDYAVRVRVEDEGGNVLDEVQRPISIKWQGLAEHIQDLDAAISQLAYIAKPRDIKFIKAGATEAEREARFREFWKRRDPTPGSERNERMEEYYYRIDYANTRYGSGEMIAGWETDRGHVVAVFGEPDFVESHPYNFNVKPYEVWYYYSIGRRFIFVDQSGFGEYQLLVPIWDERNRIR